MELEHMTREEKSLLLYLETQAVDYGGKIQSVRMNADDHTIATRWKDVGFIQFGRIAFKDIDNSTGNYPRTHWVVLSEEAWRLAHEERRVRCQRIMEKMPTERIGLVA